MDYKQALISLAPSLVIVLVTIGYYKRTIQQNCADIKQGKVDLEKAKIDLKDSVSILQEIHADDIAKITFQENEMDKRLTAAHAGNEKEIAVIKVSIGNIEKNQGRILDGLEGLRQEIRNGRNE